MAQSQPESVIPQYIGEKETARWLEIIGEQPDWLYFTLRGFATSIFNITEQAVLKIVTVRTVRTSWYNNKGRCVYADRTENLDVPIQTFIVPVGAIAQGSSRKRRPGVPIDRSFYVANVIMGNVDGPADTLVQLRFFPAKGYNPKTEEDTFRHHVVIARYSSNGYALIRRTVVEDDGDGEPTTRFTVSIPPRLN